MTRDWDGIYIESTYHFRHLLLMINRLDYVIMSLLRKAEPYTYRLGHIWGDKYRRCIEKEGVDVSADIGAL